jgi:propionyl-CoA carboxylase alpha chain
LITHGKNRDEARHLMAQALDSYVIKGVTHNIPLLRDVLENDKFASGKYSTKFLPEEYPEGFLGHQLTERSGVDLAAVAAMVYARRDSRDKQWLQGSGPALAQTPKDWDVYLSIGPSVEKHVLIKDLGSNKYQVTIDGQKPVVISGDWTLETPLIRSTVLHDGKESKFVTQYLDALPVGFRLSFMGTKVCFNKVGN